MSASIHWYWPKVRIGCFTHSCWAALYWEKAVHCGVSVSNLYCYCYILLPSHIAIESPPDLHTSNFHSLQENWRQEKPGEEVRISGIALFWSLSSGTL